MQTIGRDGHGRYRTSMANQRADERSAGRRQAGGERAQPRRTFPSAGLAQQLLQIGIVVGLQAPEQLPGELAHILAQDVGR